MTVGRQAQPVAAPAEVVGHTAYETKASSVTRDDVIAGCVVVLVRSLSHAGVLGLYTGQQFGGRHHLGFVPLVTYRGR